jgi:site-specific DNA-methyltransferase (adenine-specific)
VIWPTDYLNQVICGDCHEVMKGIPDKSVDLVLTDPPYGISINKKANCFGSSTDNSRKATNETWDDFIPGPEYFNEIFRISKNQIVFGANYFWENFYSNGCYIIWDKRGNLPDVPFAPTEFAWTSFRKQSKKYTFINHGFINDGTEKTGHPTAKPYQVISAIIRDFTETAHIILDPFFGSGTTGVAAKLLGRQFIGIEISEKYCEIARKRIDGTLVNKKLDFQEAAQ